MRLTPIDPKVGKNKLSYTTDIAFAGSDLPTKRFMGVQSSKTSNVDQSAEAKLK